MLIENGMCRSRGVSWQKQHDVRNVLASRMNEKAEVAHGGFAGLRSAAMMSDIDRSEGEVIVRPPRRYLR